MAKRCKPVLNLPTISTLEDADNMLAQIAARKRELALLNLDLKEKVDAMKLTCAAQSEPIRQDIETMEQALVRFGESRKTEYFNKKRSVALNFGILGFRQSTAVKPMRKTTWEQVLGFLRETADKSLAACVRVKHEVDRDALRQLSPEKLAEAGCRLEQTDSFFYEINETELAPDEGERQ